MSYLFIGLGNVGAKYNGTRHNIGFDVVDHLAKQKECAFELEKLAYKCQFKYKGKPIHLIKPTTFMNLSGKAVNYWKTKLKIPTERCLVIVDDLALPFGKIRIKKKGNAGGHNGLDDIQNVLGTATYPRLRFGIGDDFSKGKQIDFVLGKWSDRELETFDQDVRNAANACLSFVGIGIERTMNEFNKK